MLAHVLFYLLKLGSDGIEKNTEERKNEKWIGDNMVNKNISKDINLVFDKYADLIIALVLVLIPIVYFTIKIPELSPLLRIIGFVVVPVSVGGHLILTLLRRRT